MIKVSTPKLTIQEINSLIYHDYFDYALNPKDLNKWEVEKTIKLNSSHPTLKLSGGCYYLKGRKELLKERGLREKASAKKFILARIYGHIMNFNPFIKMVAITGALAMNNAQRNSDIDLMVVTQKGCLWLARLTTYVILWLARVPVRKPGEKNEKDKLCLNMWLDEGDLVWPKKDRNLYCAHEIAQVIPIVDRGGVYERWLFCNRWVLGYWPKAVIINKIVTKPKRVFIKLLTYLILPFELIAFGFQKWHMKGKVTREVVNINKAIFHPIDRKANVLSRLGLDKAN